MRGWSKVLLRIARISSVHFALSGTAFDTESGEDIDRLQYSFEGKRAIQVVANDVTFSIPVEGLVDFDAEKRSEEHTSELQSLMRNSYAVFCLKQKNNHRT